MSYSKSVLFREDFKRAEFEEFLDISQDELNAVFRILTFLYKIGTIDCDTANTLIVEFDCKIVKRRNDFLERTKNEILAT